MFNQIFTSVSIYLFGACYRCPLDKPKEYCELEELKCESFKDTYEKINLLTPHEGQLLAQKCKECLSSN